jgi:uncharacterized membrane protein
MTISGAIFYFLFWALMFIVPIIAGIRRYWFAAIIYTIGTLYFLLNLIRDRNGWDDLANFANLLVVVLPIYIIGTIVWIVSTYRRKRIK